MSLALQFRPQRFDDLVGQPAVQVILRQMVVKNMIPTALLFDGSQGTGKTTTARILAAALNCETTDRPCGTCYSCTATFAGSSLDVIEIDAASNGLIEDIRDLRQQVRFRVSGNHRIVILDEAHSMSKPAFNALLKTLEEPPEATVFILCTTEPDKIPDTVASRCSPFSFRRLAVADIVKRLSHITIAAGILVDNEMLQVLAERADGSMRDAIMLLEQISSVGITTAEQYRRLLGYSDHAPAILGALVSGDLLTAFQRLDEALTRVADAASLLTDTITVLRDVLVLHCDGEITKTGTALAARQSLALAVESTTVVNALKVLWELKTKARLDDSRSNLELAVVMLHEVFAKDRKTGRITLAQMGASR